MKELLRELLRIYEAGEDQMLVTVISESGSTPRGAGARMIVRQDGSTLGTVGGGAVEYEAGKQALEAICQKQSFVKEYHLNRNQVADLGMICGGNAELYFQYISSGEAGFDTLCRQALAALEKDEDSWLITDITENNHWFMKLYGEGNMDAAEKEQQVLFGRKPVKACLDERLYYSEPLVKSGKVYVFGGGHVAQELVPLLSHLDFKCVVFDDRAEFANATLFPWAFDTVVGDFEHITDSITVTEHDFICIMTRGHQFDYLLQKQALHTPARYIGVMGSRNKLRTLDQRLLEEGFSQEDIRRFHGPIGIPILAETPAEIAVSVAGELIQVRAENKR